MIIIDEVHIGNKFFQKIFEDQRFKDKVRRRWGIFPHRHLL